MNIDRIKEIQERTAFANSVSVQQALIQVWKETNRSAQVSTDNTQTIINAENEIKTLKNAMREIYEVWAGSDGFDDLSIPEGYQQNLVCNMRDIAARHMEKKP